MRGVEEVLLRRDGVEDLQAAGGRPEGTRQSDLGEQQRTGDCSASKQGDLKGARGVYGRDGQCLYDWNGSLLRVDGRSESIGKPILGEQVWRGRRSRAHSSYITF